MARRTLSYTSASLVLAGGLALGLAAPPTAQACGGFFCNSTPVVQSGEQIVYGIDDDGSLTMTVRINYTGAAPDFAWILPVPETPEISLGTTALFDALERATQPRFYVDRYRTDGTCRRTPECSYPYDPWLDSTYERGGPYPGAAVDAAAADAGSAGPTIYAQSSLGPYETVVIGGASATEIHDWLTTHGYDLPVESVPLLDAYVAGGQRFVALRLMNDASTSEIQPITLRFQGILPCLPIRLTAIATAPDLPITGFFLARARATPSNYSLIETPPSTALWLGSLSYTQWVSNEADDLGGRAFITDYAGATPAISGIALPDVLDLAGESAPERFLQELRSRGYTGDGQLQAILARFITPPDGYDARSYFNCLANGWGGCGAPTSYDPAGLAAAIDFAITQPRAAGAAMVDGHPYLTRLFTTMSADEMTIDPEFVIDEGLGDVSNLHTATRVTECDATHFEFDAPVHLELDDGRTVDAFAGRVSVGDAEYCRASGGSLRAPTLVGGGRCAATPGAGAGSGLALLGLALSGVLLARRRRDRR